MSIAVTITNLTAATLAIDELYCHLGAAGSSTASLTIVRSNAQLDSMDGLKALKNAGSVSVSMVESADNAALGTTGENQSGVITGVAVTSTGVVTSAVTFPQAYGATPNVTATAVQTASGTTWRGTLYLRSISTTGFTAALDVTTADAGTVSGENPTMAPAENGVLLGAFTTTLAAPPLTTAAITLHWLESTVAKSATITGTTTLGGSNAANLSAGSINRTTGALSVTFAGGHPPDTNSITVDYATLKSCSITWAANG